MNPNRHSPLLSAAVYLGMALSSASSAAIVAFFGQNIAIPNSYAGVSVDLETGNTSTALAGVSGGDANFYYGGAGISNDGSSAAVASSWQPVRTGSINTDPVANLGINTVVDSSSVYSSGFGGSETHFDSQFTSGTPGYIGFSLVIDDPGMPGTDKTVYGWMQVTLQDNDGVGVLHSWAYDDSGGSILVGVPEPGISVLGFLGLALAMRRQRRD